MFMLYFTVIVAEETVNHLLLIYQILTAFIKLKVMSELKLFTTGFITWYLIEDTTALNVSTKPLKTVGRGSRV